jgi:uncharacterized iron-regulated protein
MNFRKTLLFILLFILLIDVDGVFSLAYKSVLRVRDGAIIPFDQMIAEVKKADMVFVGEEHDNKKNHRAQLDIISSLAGKAVPIAIGLEMFRAESQKDLNLWVKGSIKPDLFLKVYYDNWNLPWPLYKDIFLYSRENKIPMIGLNIPQQISKKISAEGFSSLSPGELKQLPPGISCDIDDQYMSFIKRVYEVHGGNKKSFTNFCEAQMVWDKSMAWRLIDFKKSNPGRTIVVLAGAGHSWNHGIPAQIKRASRFATVAILPEVPDKLQRTNANTGDADYILLD